MFTSRAERRLLLRQDNAFLRLSEKAFVRGLIDDNQFKLFLQEKKYVEKTLESLRSGYNSNDLLHLFGNNTKLFNEQILPYTDESTSSRALQSIHSEIRYKPYLDREKKEVEKMLRYQNLFIPESIVYKDMPGLSKELQQKLLQYKPGTIAQAGLIPGMTPAALSLLIIKSKNIYKK